MRDAYGGVVNIAIIVVFLVLVSGYLAFNVNYTKAFRLKNEIISVLEEYEGNGFESIGDGCGGGTNAICNRIKDYASQIGYNASTINPPNDNGTWKCDKTVGYCVGLFTEDNVTNISGSTNSSEMQKIYFIVKTQININIPIINNIMGLRIFQVSGSTKTITKLKR